MTQCYHMHKPAYVLCDGLFASIQYAITLAAEENASIEYAIILGAGVNTSQGSMWISTGILQQSRME